MSVLSRIASGLPRLACTVLPTVVDAALAINLVNILRPKSANEAQWMWGVSTLSGIATAGLLRTRADMSKIPAGLIYLSWKVYQVYIYRKACDQEETDQQTKEKQAQDEFFDMLRRGNGESIKTCFTKKPQLFSGTNKQGMNALHIFAERGSEDLVKWILIVGKDLNLNVAISQDGNSKGWKPLHCAVKEGKLECAKLLYHQNPDDLKLEIPNVGNARAIAFEYGQVNVVEWLEQEGKLFDENQTALQLFETIFSKEVRKSDAIEWLFKKCKNENLDLKKLILISVQKGHLVNVKWLCEKDKNAIQFKDDSGNNLMWIALVNNQLGIAQWLDEKDKKLFDQAIQGKKLDLINPKNDPVMSKWLSDRMLTNKF